MGVPTCPLLALRISPGIIQVPSVLSQCRRSASASVQGVQHLLRCFAALRQQRCKTSLRWVLHGRVVKWLSDCPPCLFSTWSAIRPKLLYDMLECGTFSHSIFVVLCFC